MIERGVRDGKMARFRRDGTGFVALRACSTPPRRLEFGESTNLKARICVRHASGFCKYGAECPCGGRVAVPPKHEVAKVAAASLEDADDVLAAFSDQDTAGRRWFPHGPEGFAAYRKAQAAWRAAPLRKRVRVTKSSVPAPVPVDQPYKYFVALSLNGNVDGRWETWEDGEREVMEVSAVLLKPVFVEDPDNIYTKYGDKSSAKPFRGVYEVDRFHEFVSPAFYRTKRFLRRHTKNETDEVQFWKDSLGISFEEAMASLRFWLLSHSLYYPWDDKLDRRMVDFALVVHDGNNFRQRVALQVRALETASMPVRRRKGVQFPKILQEWVDIQDMYRVSPLYKGDAKADVPLEEMMEQLEIDPMTPQGDVIDRSEAISKVLIALWALGGHARLSKRVRLEVDDETYTAPKKAP